MSSINLTNIIRKDNDGLTRLARLESALNGKSWMNLNVVCYPIGGSYNVDVESSGIVTKEELHEMVTALLSDYIMDGE